MNYILIYKKQKYILKIGVVINTDFEIFLYVQ